MCSPLKVTDNSISSLTHTHKQKTNSNHQHVKSKSAASKNEEPSQTIGIKAGLSRDAHLRPGVLDSIGAVTKVLHFQVDAVVCSFLLPTALTF